MIELSKNNVKYIRSLHLKKFRDKFNKFIAEGDKICLEMLRTSQLKIEMVVATSDWIDKHQIQLRPHNTVLYQAKKEDLKKISQLSTASQVLIIAEKSQFQAQDLNLHQYWAIYLDGIQDPGNLGSILRIADWFAWPYVITSKDSADPFNAKCIQASMGAFLRVNQLRLDLPDLLSHLDENTKVYGTSMQGQNIFKSKTAQKGILIIGNEGKGIRPELRPYIHEFLSIPGSTGGAESLNAAVACGIVVAVLENSEI